MQRINSFLSSFGKKNLLMGLLLSLATIGWLQEGSSQEKTNLLTRPAFYRGIYLHNYSSTSEKKVDEFIAKAKKHHINSFVMDVQKGGGSGISLVSKKIVSKVKDSGIWPIARVVVFDQGFDHYPIKDSLIKNRISIAVKAAQQGFPEIQFDYIRFADSGRLKHIKLAERYKVVEGFLAKAKQELKPYNVITAADVFGRIPLNTSDLIGQRMEGLAEVVDIICPMAYPSHYTWSPKLMADPYHTVHITSKKGHDRVKGKAEVVTWIQGFNLKVDRSKMSLKKYIIEQIRATEDAGIRGFLVWNAGQRYQATYEAMDAHYGLKQSQQKPKEPITQAKESPAPPSQID